MEKISDENTVALYSHLGDYPNRSYYHIDSVSLIPSALSISDNSLDNLVTIYPNPTHNEINIEIKNNNLIKSIKLYNILGEVIIERNIDDYQLNINMSEFSSGIYLLEIIDSHSNRVVKRINKL